MPVDGEKFLAKLDILAVDRVEIALAEGEIVDCIEQVGLARAVVAHEAVDIVAQLHVNLAVVLEIIQYQPIQHHNS
jgi:ABC-type antimicrobial peptide transport system ATPase subunit